MAIPLRFRRSSGEELARVADSAALSPRRLEASLMDEFCRTAEIVAFPTHLLVLESISNSNSAMKVEVCAATQAGKKEVQPAE
jgi:hypothetical protein